MARLARIVVPGIPHHIIQRGNRKQNTFFQNDDYKIYLNLMSEWCNKCGVEIWAYCLMTNHVHLVAVPKEPAALRQSIGEAHRRYSRYINFKKGWRGYLWQGRFASYPLDERYLLEATRYIELNPVKAKLCRTPEEYPWSSGKAHETGQNDMLVNAKPILDRVGDWKNFISEKNMINPEILERHERTGRPLGADEFIHTIEKTLKRKVARQKPGRKPK